MIKFTFIFYSIMIKQIHFFILMMIFYQTNYFILHLYMARQTTMNRDRNYYYQIYFLQ